MLKFCTLWPVAGLLVSAAERAALVAAGEVTCRQHHGGHTPPPDWPYFLELAVRYLKAEGEAAL